MLAPFDSAMGRLFSAAHSGATVGRETRPLGIPPVRACLPDDRDGIVAAVSGEHRSTAHHRERRPTMEMTRRITGRWRVAAKLAVLIGVIVVASSQFMGTPRAADPIKIGWVGPLSPPGGYAEGALMKQAAELAAAEVNAKGGVLGRQIEVVFADTRG